jgi:hypothetical protein
MMNPFVLTCNERDHNRWAGFRDFSTCSNCKSDDDDDTDGFTHVGLRDAVIVVALDSYVSFISNRKSKICICILYTTSVIYSKLKYRNCSYNYTGYVHTNQMNIKKLKVYLHYRSTVLTTCLVM